MVASGAFNERGERRRRRQRRRVDARTAVTAVGAECARGELGTLAAIIAVAVVEEGAESGVAASRAAGKGWWVWRGRRDDAEATIRTVGAQVAVAVLGTSPTVVAVAI